MNAKKPPFTLNNNILSLSLDIANNLGAVSVLKSARPEVKLRKSNQIKTIQSSLSIEGNTLTVEQVSDIIDKSPVYGPEKDILEVKNAIRVYQNLHDFDARKISDFKRAHTFLMQDLIEDAGKLRLGNVGIFAGQNIAHVAPPAKQVPGLMQDLFSFLSASDETPILIKACVFHYELEFIHPFSDGNGRIGRLWQQIILMGHHPVFEFISIEALIKENQAHYYNILGECDQAGESTRFVEFMLSLMQRALNDYHSKTSYVPSTKDERIAYAKDTFSHSSFSRKDYMLLLKTVSSATASRDIAYAVNKGLLQQSGDKRTARYTFN